jgi:hypothetical protein
MILSVLAEAIADTSPQSDAADGISTRFSR